MNNKTTISMSREIAEFSEMIDDQFEVFEKPVLGFLSFLWNFFK